MNVIITFNLSLESDLFSERFVNPIPNILIKLESISRCIMTIKVVQV